MKLTFMYMGIKFTNKVALQIDSLTTVMYRSAVIIVLHVLPL